MFIFLFTKAGKERININQIIRYVANTKDGGSLINLNEFYDYGGKSHISSLTFTLKVAETPKEIDTLISDALYKQMEPLCIAIEQSIISGFRQTQR